MRVAIIGLGYVGLTTLATFAYLGHKVIGVEKDESKLSLLREGKVPFYEPGLPELLDLVTENVSFTSEARDAVGEAELVMIAVGTHKKPQARPIAPKWRRLPAKWPKPFFPDEPTRWW